MNDLEMEDLLSKSLDEPLSADESARLDAAMAQSAELREMARDLMAIKAVAAAGRPQAPPLSEQLLERVAATAPIKPGLRRYWAPMALAAAAALIFFLMPPQTPQDEDTLLQDQLYQAQAHAGQFRMDYHNRITAMEGLAVKHLSQLPAKQAISYSERLGFINRMIGNCEDAVDSAILRPETHAGLAEVYDAKVTLLDLILEA